MRMEMFVLGVLVVGAFALFMARKYAQRLQPDNPNAKRITGAGMNYWACTVPMLAGIAILEETADGNDPLAIAFLVLVVAWLFGGEWLLKSYGIQLYERGPKAAGDDSRRGRRR